MSFLARAGRGAFRQLRTPSQPIASFGNARAFSEASPAPAGGDDDDIVMQAFKEQTAQYKQVYEASKSLQVPLNGDLNAIKKYAQEMESIKKKAGSLDPMEAASAKMDYDLECSGYNVRQFLAHVSDQGELGELGNSVLSDILAAVDSIEEDTDAVLDGENEEGWDTFQSKIADIGKKHGLEDFEKIKQEGVVDQYKAQLDELRTQAQEDMEVAKRKDGLDWVNVDPAQLKPKFT